MCPKSFLKIAVKPNNYQLYLPKFLQFCDNMSHKLLRQAIPEEMFEKSAMVHLAEISHAPPLSPPPSTQAY